MPAPIPSDSVSRRKQTIRMKYAKLYSPFGMGIVKVLKKLPKKLFLMEVRPWFNPHRPERLTEQLQSLLVSEAEEEPQVLMSVDEDPLSTPLPELKAIRAALEKADPDTYVGNAYGRLIDRGLLPRGLLPSHSCLTLRPCRRLDLIEGSMSRATFRRHWQAALAGLGRGCSGVACYRARPDLV